MNAGVASKHGGIMLPQGIFVVIYHVHIADVYSLGRRFQLVLDFVVHKWDHCF